jgi:hypothetical protein
MDEIWQRHKTFILQCVIGGFAFLIALVLITNAYSGTKDLQASNRGLKNDLQKRVSDKLAPSPASIAAQKQKAEDALAQIRAMSGQVASQAQGEDYVRENIVWTLALAGRPRTDAEPFLAIYKQLPQTCLTSVREAARSVLVGEAAQKGKQIDETFGLAAGVADDEVPGGLHALAIVCDVIRRALERDGVVSVTDVRVNPRNVLDRDLSWVSGVEVRLAVTGDPDDVSSLLRSFNAPDPRMQRMTVLREIESITRRSPDDDTVKANVVLLGLQVKGVQGEDR